MSKQISVDKSGNRRVHINSWIDEVDYADLVEIASKHKISLSYAVREAVKQFIRGAL